MISPLGLPVYLTLNIWREKQIANRQQFSLVCTLIDHTNDLKTFKTKVEPRAAGEWFPCKVMNILTSFLWSIRVQTVENCCGFVFNNNINSF